MNDVYIIIQDVNNNFYLEYNDGLIPISKECINKLIITGKLLDNKYHREQKLNELLK